MISDDEQTSSWEMAFLMLVSDIDIEYARIAWAGDRVSFDISPVGAIPNLADA